MARGAAARSAIGVALRRPRRLLPSAPSARRFATGLEAGAPLAARPKAPLATLPDGETAEPRGVQGGRAEHVQLELDAAGTWPFVTVAEMADAVPPSPAVETTLKTHLVDVVDAHDVPALIEARDFSQGDLATALHRLGASQDASNQHLLQELLGRAAATIAESDPRGLAQACCSVAKIRGVEASHFFAVASARAVDTIESFEAHDLASIVWAFATAGEAHRSLFEAVALKARQKVSAFEAQDLANTAWAFAQAQVPAPSLFAAIAVEGLKKIAAFTAQELADLVWAYWQLERRT
ncbi:hypothetical protein M885DRAFT_571534 [Pelagophyceae sp. CCMP2097]|nr:hypothetical protein M885DRAFT_571534 [Pelagophyceae sp. CCMP2097]